MNNQDNSQLIGGTQTNDEDVRTILSQSQSTDAPIGSYGSSNSNNVLNTNLSGSMKRFSRNRGSNNSSDDDDDNDDGRNRYHDCQTIFAPISKSQPITNPFDEQVTTQSNVEQSTSTHQRIAVAALPNLEYDQFTRGFSASSPSIYSHAENNSRRNSDGSDQRRTDFIRNATASSTNYFM